MKQTTKKWLFWAILAGIYFITFTVQSRILFNWDVSWLTWVTKRLWAGGNYTNDFFDINPPIILYLYTPPVLLTKLLHIPIYTTVRLYVALLASISFSLCYLFCQRIFSREDRGMAYGFLLTIAITLLILPAYEFGQREHLLVIFTLPYFLLTVLRLQNYPSINRSAAIAIGLFAGLGFAIKAYFLAAFVFVELYALIISRRWIKPETIAVGSLMVVYCISIFIFHPDYIYTVLPKTMDTYYSSYHMAWTKTMNTPFVFFCGYALLFYFMRPYNNAYTKLRAVLLLAVAGFLVSYFIQQTNWFYHILPAFSAATLLLALTFMLNIKQPLNRENNFISLIGFVLLITTLGFLFHFFMQHSIAFKQHYLPPTYCGVLLLWTFLFLTSERPVIFPALLISLLTTALSVFFIQHNLAAKNLFFSFLFVTAFGWLILRTPTKSYYSFFIAALGGMIIAFPCCMVYDMYFVSLSYKEKSSILISYLQNHAQHEPIYIFSTSTIFTFPAVDYADAIPASRFDHLSWIPALVKHPNPKIIQASNALTALFIKDLAYYKPKLILIEAQEYKPNLDSLHFNYLNYFSKNPEFRKLWKNYHYVTTLKQPGFCRLDVYQRNTIWHN